MKRRKQTESHNGNERAFISIATDANLRCTCIVNRLFPYAIIPEPHHTCINTIGQRIPYVM